MHVGMWTCPPKDKSARNCACWNVDLHSQRQVQERRSPVLSVGRKPSWWKTTVLEVYESVSPKMLLKAYCLGMLVTEQSRCHLVTGQSRNIPQECLFLYILLCVKRRFSHTCDWIWCQTMPRHWQMLQVQQKFDWHDAVVFYTVWVNRLWFCKLCRQNLFFTLHGWTDQFLAHYVLELTMWFLHTACLWFCKECLMAELSGSAHFGWIPSSTEQENKRACCMGGFQQWQSRRAREHTVWVDFNITRAGEQESLLYRWIPTLAEQESQRTGLHHGSCWGTGVWTDI